MAKTRLFSYCIPVDDGAAPNPYWGVCTLAICKPKIRSKAAKGDWVVGLGSANSPIGDISDRVVYAMKVTDVIGFWGYDMYCREKLPGKIPDWSSSDFRRRVGDCIYDYTNGNPPDMRKGVHGESSRERDLGGKNVLMSTHFYYFGDNPVPLPEHLKPIIHGTQGHKSNMNRAHVEAFVSWIENLGYESNKLYGEPQLKSEFERNCDIENWCALRDFEDDEDEPDAGC